MYARACCVTGVVVVVHLTLDLEKFRLFKRRDGKKNCNAGSDFFKDF